MKWTKLGQIFKMEQLHPLLLSHAANPLPVWLEGDVFRVFYSARDREKRSSVSFVDIDIVKKLIVYRHTEPVFMYGDSNSFYSHGVSIGNLFSVGDIDYILFMGWKIPENDHWRGYIGRLKLIDKKVITTDSDILVFDDDFHDNISLSYPFVLFHDGLYKMWYGSTISWETVNGEMLHVIKYATSHDGFNWSKHGVAIPFEIGVAQAFSHPSVIIDQEGYHMWYSYRSGTGISYRIGYSFSKDGLNWENKLKDVGIDISNDGWDSEMICYPFVFDHKDKRYLLYNGNDYGREGFGLAILENNS